MTNSISALAIHVWLQEGTIPTLKIVEKKPIGDKSSKQGKNSFAWTKTKLFLDSKGQNVLRKVGKT